jgi:hypothetical protein
MDEILTCARRAYGDLQKPDYSFFSEALETLPWRPVIDQLRQFLRVEDWTDREDDVSFSYVLKPGHRARAAWLLWLSAVGPFALLTYGLADTELERGHVLTEPRAEGPAEEARIVQVLRDAGLQLLSAEEVESTVVDFRPWNGKFPASTFVLLFGDTDVPWWHAQ